MQSPDQPNPILAAYHKRWTKNEDFIKGRDAVIAAGEAYLQKPTPRMSDAEYVSFKETVGFFPGVLSILAGQLGLVFRDEPDLIGPTALTDLEYVITRDGDSLEEFSRKVMREALTNNWGGTLIDHPVLLAGTSLSAANAIAEGFRPYLAHYPAKAILDIEYGIRKNRRVISYLRLLETQSKVLEYRLVNGECVVVIHTKDDNGQWTASTPSYPVKDVNGTATRLDFIPFQLITTTQSKYPTPSALEHMVDLNCDILNIEGLMAQACRYVANPIVSAMGIAAEFNEDGTEKVRQWPYGPGVVWQVGGDAKIDVKEMEGKGLDALQKRLDEKKSQMARTGARLLQDDKAAAEAVETVVVRQTADNARLSSITRTVAHQIEKALIVMTDWMGADSSTVSFKLNTDYTDHTFSKDRLDALIAADQAGYVYDKVIYHELTKPGGLVDPAVSYDLWQSEVDAKRLNTPSAGLTFNGGANG